MIDIQRIAAKKFAETWKGRGYEKGHSQSFWLELLQKVFLIEDPFSFIKFEEKVKMTNTGFIDARISKTKVLIEQKSIGVDLKKEKLQSDGELCTPFGQAKRYISALPLSEHPRWVVLCNFKSFLIFDMEQPNGEPFEVLLENLEREYQRLDFLVSTGLVHLRQEKEVSFKAGELIGKLYNALLGQYKDPTSSHSLHSLNVLCVRLVFCLYSEDAGLFGTNHSAFYDYLRPYQIPQMRGALIELFKVLDTEIDRRDPYLLDNIKKFPYVNGGLFHDETPTEIPHFTEEIAELLLEDCSSGFDWSRISPTIFGAVFESTLNPETRKSEAMHYTSLENIHKVIDPLFLDDLKNELDQIKKINAKKTRNHKLSEFQEKLANLKFLDPACGSGNFLTETYLSLRRLENEMIAIYYDGYPLFNLGDPIKVSIENFYGIEINDFAVSVAATALWIAESQMWHETENLVQFDGEFLPLKTNNNIHNKNAFDINWHDVVPPMNLNFIIGNPPFIGARYMSDVQKADKIKVFGDDWKYLGSLDYVCCWLYKSLQFMSYNNDIKAAIVATNSVCQGEQVPALWTPLFERGITIDFGYQSFPWESEAKDKAHVHCVIIGFSAKNDGRVKRLFVGNNLYYVNNINGYLQGKANDTIEKHSKAICTEAPIMQLGNKAIDDSCLSKYSTSEKEAIIDKYPKAKLFFKRCYGANEYLNGRERWCLWLKDFAPSTYSGIKPIMDAVNKVKEYRKGSKREQTRMFANVPMLFGEIRQPNTSYLIVPLVNTEKRVYIPMDFFNSDVIPTHQLGVIQNATMYHFGVLQSIIHMAWMRFVCGRQEMRTRYSVNIVYNNFPWPSPTDSQIAKIEKTAQAILDIRKKYSNWKPFDLYGNLMPLDLIKAHKANDKAVMEAYGMNPKDYTEDKSNAILLNLYNKIVYG